MILDTSVLYDSLVDAALSEAARAVVTSDTMLRSPDLIQVEIAGAITRAVRRKDITPGYAADIFIRAQQLLPDLEPAATFLRRAFSISLDIGHPLSDCVFLTHAEVRGELLVTSDAQFIRKLAGTPYARHVIHLADWHL